MQFKTPDIEREWTEALLHPELRAALVALDKFCMDNVLPEPVVTDLLRPEGEKFSWHPFGAGADVRVHLYDEQQAALVLAYLEHIARRPRFEVLRHDSGQGDHIHIGVRDHQWRQQVTAVAGPPKGEA